MRRVARTPAIVIATYAALGLAWAITNAPFAAPDEEAHYVRAIGIGNGSLVGTPAPAYTSHAFDPLQLAWTRQAARAVAIPPGLSPLGVGCEIGGPGMSAACSDRAAPNSTTTTEITPVGTYEPLPYLLPAALMRLANHAAGADRLARVASLLVWVAMLAIAAAALWDAEAGIAAFAGLMVAISPMAVFIGSSLNGSSLEIAGSAAFFATLLRLLRGDGSPPRWVWVLAGAAGAALALSRSLGPAWVVADLAVAAVFAGRAQVIELLRANTRRASFAGAAVLASVALNRIWEAAYGPKLTPTLVPHRASLSAGGRELMRTLNEVIGNFGYLNVPLSPIVLWAWAAIALALGIVAIGAANRRGRIALAFAALVAVGGPIYLFASVSRLTGFGLQGRHYMPLLMALPLLAGELVRRHRERIAAATLRWLLAVIGIVVGAAQLAAWWTNSHRYAVGANDPWWFFPHAQWSPPGGWVPWLIVVLAATLVPIGGGIAMAVSGRGRRSATQ